MNAISMMPEEALWRSRKVQYFAGSWEALESILPAFQLVPFSAGADEPPNPFLQSVIRLPLTTVERPMPVGVVSHTYSLAQHREVAALCRDGLINVPHAKIEPDELRYEVGLSELGEWMNFRIYLPERYEFTDSHREKLALRLECFNSVDGSSRLSVLFGWFRFVCANGLVIGKTKIEINERHGQSLQLQTLPERIRPALKEVEADRKRLKRWLDEPVGMDRIATWANGTLSEKWGKRASVRVFHICESGRDVEIDDPFAPGSATEKPVRHLSRVPGSPKRAETKYDVAQALSYVASGRNNTEERVARQADIPTLIEHLM